MKFRVARHTTDLAAMVHFYRDILELEVIGSFEGHDGYDGVFLGMKGADWHLEFTVSGDKPVHQPDEDDLLVFYAADENEWNRLREKCKANGITEHVPKNPYWAINGVLYKDPDGYGVMIAWTHL